MFEEFDLSHRLPVGELMVRSKANQVNRQLSKIEGKGPFRVSCSFKGGSPVNFPIHTQEDLLRVASYLLEHEKDISGWSGSRIFQAVE